MNDPDKTITTLDGPVNTTPQDRAIVTRLIRERVPVAEQRDVLEHLGLVEPAVPPKTWRRAS